MDLNDIKNLIMFVAKCDASEVKLEMDDIKITIKTGSESDTKIVQQIPTQVPQITQAEAQPAAASESSKYIVIKSPIIGTFYRKPSPDKPLFAEVGQTIAEGDVLCIIEAMKLFNKIESEVSGKIVKIMVDDSSPVEFDQPLFLVDPS